MCFAPDVNKKMKCAADYSVSNYWIRFVDVALFFVFFYTFEQNKQRIRQVDVFG